MRGAWPSGGRSSADSVATVPRSRRLSSPNGRWRGAAEGCLIPRGKLPSREIPNRSGQNRIFFRSIWQSLGSPLLTVRCDAEGTLRRRSTLWASVWSWTLVDFHYVQQRGRPRVNIAVRLNVLSALAVCAAFAFV